MHIFSPGRIEDTFYQANVVFGVFFYVSVCSGEANLATSEINFCEHQLPLDIEVVLSVRKALAFRLTTFVGIHLLWEYNISSFDFFDTYIVR